MQLLVRLQNGDNRSSTTRIALISLEEGTVEVVKEFAYRSYENYGSSLRFSPDGRFIAYEFMPDDNSGQTDIALMSLIIYRALLIMRGTRAIQSLAGLLVLMLLYVASDWGDLVSINWLLEKFFELIVLAVIILFQQDIRRGLARAGGRLFDGLLALRAG